MKKLVKFIRVNDGKPLEVQNDDFLLIESYPRVERLIETFLSYGWTLEKILKNTDPSIQEEGAYTFFSGGWDLVFVKEAVDEENDGDKVLQEAISQGLE